MVSFSHPQILEGQVPDPLRNNLRHKVDRLCANWRVIPAKLVIQGELECSEDIVGGDGCSERTHAGAERSRLSVSRLISMSYPKKS